MIARLLWLSETLFRTVFFPKCEQIRTIVDHIYANDHMEQHIHKLCNRQLQPGRLFVILLHFFVIMGTAAAGSLHIILPAFQPHSRCSLAI